MVPGLRRMLHRTAGSGREPVLRSPGRRRAEQAAAARAAPSGPPGSCPSVWSSNNGLRCHSLGQWSSPRIRTEVAQRPEKGAIAVVPLLGRRTCAWQHRHGRPLLGGMLENQAGTAPEQRTFIAESPLLVDLWALGRDAESWLDPGSPISILWPRASIRSSSTERLDGGPPRRGDPERALSQALGRPVASTPDGAIWLLPEAGRPGTPTDTRTFQLEGPPGPDPKRGTQRPSRPR